MPFTDIKEYTETALTPNHKINKINSLANHWRCPDLLDEWCF